MNFEPQKFFIGLMDFFSILLPGALVTYLLLDDVAPIVLGKPIPDLNTGEAWAAFLFASYLLGHLVFLIGSWFDGLYAWLRDRTLDAQIKRATLRGSVSRWPVRALVWSIFKHDRNLALKGAKKIKERVLASLQAQEAINTFQWSKALLNVESSESLGLVQRFEADSKFFRCFSVVMLFVLATWGWQDQWPRIGIPIVIGLLLLALWRYMEQRFKSISQAYWSIITLAASGKIAVANAPSTAPTAPLAKDADPPRAGGVVFRVSRGKVRYLLVEASDDPSQWVLPKGHVEPGETHREAAVREVHEETGVWAAIGMNDPLPPDVTELDREKLLASGRTASDMVDVSYRVDGVETTVRFFLMQAIGRGRRTDKTRAHKWLPLPDALKRATHPETRALIKSAEKRRSQMTSA